MKIRFAMALMTLSLVPAAAQAQNDTVATAANLTTNGPSVYQFYITANPERWYRYEVVAGQSYCIETATAFFENKQVDTVIEVFEENGTTVIGTNDDAGGQPDSFRGSRFCYTANGSGVFDTVLVRAFGAAPTAATYFQVRVAGNMLYCPWWFTDASFDAFIEYRNTTSVSVSATFTVRNTAGAVVGVPFTTSIPANTGTAISIKTQFGAASGAGSIEIAHNAAPGAIVANTTSFSFGTGVSFDAPFMMRQQPSW